MKILIIEPYYTGSHKQWADGFKKHSKHTVKILSLKGQFWKWRMHGGAITLAQNFHEMDWRPDLILVTDMLDLTTFLSLTRKKTFDIPTVIYFHENQISYPWSPNDRDVKNKRDNHYGFINYSSALTADKVLFNSKFHMDSFLNALHPFLKQFPDQRCIDTIKIIKEKSDVLHLGIDLKYFNKHQQKYNNNKPLILWNHRWEYDKNPETFFDVLKKIKDDGYDFNLAVLGENFSQSPKVFENSKKEFKNSIIQWGYVDSFKDYAKLLWKSDIIPVTSNQEFFGASVMEAIYCDVQPILPTRLAYPELIPKEYHLDIFYNNETELLIKIKNEILNIKKPKNRLIRKIASRFDWQKIISNYDKVLSSIL